MTTHCQDVGLPFGLGLEADLEYVAERTSDGGFYAGTVCKGERHGVGTLLYGSGDAYCGDWLGDERHGWGVLAKGSNYRYEGTWAENEQCGIGSTSQTSDFKHIGQYSMNQRHGRGILVQGNGLLYSGKWSRGDAIFRELLFQRFLRLSYPDTANRAESNTRRPSSSSSSSSSSSDNSSSYSGSQGSRGDANASRSETSEASLTSTGHNDNDPPKASRRTSIAKFAKSFRRVQRLSSVSALHEWGEAEVSYFLRAMGVSASVSDTFHRHKIDGVCIIQGFSRFTALLEHELGVSDACIRRFIVIAFGTLLKIRRRFYADHSMRSIAALSEKLAGLCISTRGLYLQKRIGEGGYGKVFKGEYKFTSDEANDRDGLGRGVPVAVKVFRHRMGVGRGAGSSLDVCGRYRRQQRVILRDFLTEAQMLSKLRHPNITTMYGAITSPLLCLVSEYVPCGSLFDLVHRHKHRLTLQQIVRMAGEVACALAYLHSRNIVHCDLKSSNILLNEVGSVKLCDFGLATNVFDQDDGELRQALLGCIGTHQWMAPEVLRGEATSPASDVWSFGVILWEMLSQQVPFRGMSLAHIVAWCGYGGHMPYEFDSQRASLVLSENCKEGKIAESEVCLEKSALAPLPPQISAMLRCCLRAAPASRPSAMTLASTLSALNNSAVLSVEENLLSFFGMCDTE